MEKILIVKGDVNDADYVYNIQKLRKDDNLELLSKVAGVLKSHKLDNYGTNWDSYAKSVYVEEGLLTEEEVEDFDDIYKPRGRDALPVHSIDAIKILDVAEESTLLGRV
jgi:hypothetical protein